MSVANLRKRLAGSTIFKTADTRDVETKFLERAEEREIVVEGGIEPEVEVDLADGDAVAVTRQSEVPMDNDGGAPDNEVLDIMSAEDLRHRTQCLPMDYGRHDSGVRLRRPFLAAARNCR